jgi:3D (Asp-Asp-Asp) domain-containing protein
MFKKHISKIFYGVIFILLLGIIYGQHNQHLKLIKLYNTAEDTHCLELESINEKHTKEVSMLKSVISKFSGDVRENVKVLYAAQVNTATSYSNRVCETDSTPNITASNEFVTDFTAAVSWDLREMGFEFGTIAYIEELGEFVRIQDLMNKRFCKRIDVFNTNTKEAIKFGKKRVTVYLLDDVKI